MTETDQTGAVLTTYSREPGQFGILLSEHRSGVEYYHHYDALGSTMILTGDSGAVTDSFVYDAWGNSVARVGTTPTPYQWIGLYGYYYDPLIDSYYVRRRTYAQSVARWSSVDPLYGMTTTLINPYQLAQPVNDVDPTGLLNLSFYWQTDGSIGQDADPTTWYAILQGEPSNWRCWFCSPKLIFDQMRGTWWGRIRWGNGAPSDTWGQPVGVATGSYSHGGRSVTSMVQLDSGAGGACNTVVTSQNGLPVGGQDSGEVTVSAEEFCTGSYQLTFQFFNRIVVSGTGAGGTARYPGGAFQRTNPAPGTPRTFAEVKVVSLTKSLQRSRTELFKWTPTLTNALPSTVQSISGEIQIVDITKQ